MPCALCVTYGSQMCASRSAGMPRPAIAHRQLDGLAGRARRAHALHAHDDLAARRARLHRVQQHVAERARERVVVPVHERHVVGDLHAPGELLGHRRRDRPARELPEVHVGRGAVGQAAELREAARHALQARGLRGEHLHDLALRGRRVASQPLDREADRRQRVLELVRDAARGLAERLRALRLQRACAPLGQRARHRAHATAQRAELGRAARLGLVGHGLAGLHERGPSHDLVERATELPTQMSCDARGADDQQRHGEQPGRRAARDPHAARRSCSGAPARAIRAAPARARRTRARRRCPSAGRARAPARAHPSRPPAPTPHSHS